MRDLMALGAILFLVPLALRNAFAAYLLWGWSSLIAIDSYLFGFMTSMRFNLVFAVLALGMLLLGSGKLEARYSMNRSSILLILFLLQGTLSAIFAYPDVPTNWPYYENFAKLLMFVLVMPLVVVGRYRIHAMVVAICLGLTFHGLLDGIKVIASGGGHIVVGLSKFGDNNHFAVVILMAIPMLLYLYKHSANRLIRWVALGAAALTLIAVVGTRSRGGLIAMVAGSGWLILIGRRKFLGLSIGAGLMVLIAFFAPSSWLERMDSIKSANEDSSFVGRVEAWQVSSAIALHNPILGGGFHAVQSKPVWDRFHGETGLFGFVSAAAVPATRPRAAHSIYFEIMGDMGFIGFLLFLAILANILLTATEIRRIALTQGGNMGWAVDLAGAFSATTIILMIGGAAVSLAYQETLYMVAMLSELLKKHVLSFNPSIPELAKTN